MKSNNTTTKADLLPITRKLPVFYHATIVIVLILGGLSIAGLLFPTRIYPTDTLLQSFLTNDLVNLIIGVPILLGSMWLAQQNKLVGLLFWPGALIYVVYNYMAYLFGMPFGWTFPFYVILVIGSLYVALQLVASIDREAVKQQLTGVVHEKLSGGVLIGFGILFFLRVLSILVTTVTGGTKLPATEIALLLSDSVLSIPCVFCGLLLLRRKPLGYATAGALLFQTSTLFIGLTLLLILRPLFTNLAFNLVDILTIFVMGLVSFIPFGLYTRGIVQIG
jgi:hypothetical protein